MPGPSLSCGGVGLLIAAGWSFNLLDVQGKSMLRFHAGGTENCPDGAGSSSLLADNLAQVRMGDAEEESGSFALLDCNDRNFVREIDQGSCHIPDQCNHGLRQIVRN